MIRICQKTISTIKSSTGFIRSPEEGLNIVQNLISDSDREHFIVIALNTKNQPTSMEIAHIGSLNTCVVHPREIFKSAILSNAACIFLAHNHPSQNTSPSTEDITMTKRLVEAGNLLGIEVIDHIIVNNNDEYFSMKENHYI
ncbi:JAB domain-containing protein [Salinicoccus roseus]|uniref:JAB domain-containing protein n=1 Tax=Salinicoccus roseus TaxID=45670 RepID=UPI0022FFE50B|nr:JAB domain-containing protein [Salinicoccus roseus]